jgi:2-keto-4-pentenoate hydratase/2-oxohepta-3-ene-1,7-dioic acid hydratase in catechol pathway
VKLAAYTHGAVRGIGMVDGDQIIPIRGTANGSAVVLDLVAAGAFIKSGFSAEREAPLPLSTVKIMAPIPLPRRNIFCVGKNYVQHAAEFARSGFDSSAAAGEIPPYPIIFSKVPESVIGPGEPIIIDRAVSTSIDYEAELGVIIGTGGRGITKANAMQHVWGYTIINDMTARDVQGRHSQWLLGKSQDTFCPMGPWAVTADEIDLGNTQVRCWVNDELRQDANTRDLIFDVPTLIETISAGITLLPGDIIATGTPAGVGIGFKPPRYLKGGDVVRIEITGLGVLENPLVERVA